MQRSKFNPAQEEIIRDSSRYIQVIAAAGSGKTSTMVGFVERCISDGTDPREILVLSFTRKAAGEIKHRIQINTGQKGVRVHTFHSFCFQSLARHHPDFQQRMPGILLPSERNGFFRNWFRKDPSLIGGIPYELLTNPSALPEEFPKDWLPIVREEYAKFKKGQGKMDFDDLVAIFLEALEKREPWTEAVRSSLKRILVDEFQDTNHEQLTFVKLLSDTASILVVGDDSQSIYSFRGSNVKLFLDYPKLFQGTSQHALTTNYRSLPKIVEISTIPIDRNKSKIPKIVQAHRSGKALVGLVKINRISDLFPFLGQAYRFSRGELKILCRSNHRIREYIRAGIPEELLMTIHASKGLEFHTVFVDIADGWNVKRTSPQEVLEEEHRILYVALSRAKDSLVIIGSMRNSGRETAEDHFFSYFAKALPTWKKPPR
ncbi:UvrD-helicase domain-containing protein [Leptospira inadai]|nr:ATP-dependent helicase [Leptospira inadai]PNV71664.1 damage-inducible protein [Leptospira inadai serovar Lyme]